MEDVLTDAPPPSRFFEEDLDNFADQPPTLPSPFLVTSPNPNPNPALLIIAISKPSLHLFHCLPDKTTAGTLIIPETPLAGDSLLRPSPRDSACHIYAVGSAIVVTVQCAVAAERARAVAKVLVEGIKAGRVLVLDSIRAQNYRGRLAVDETMAFKLETSAQRADREAAAVKGIGYFPSGSVMDGLGAAVLAECQVRKVKGTLLATWPDSAGSGYPLVKVLVSALEGVTTGLDLEVAAGPMKASTRASDMYT